MLKSVLYFVGQVLAALIVAGVGGFVLLVYGGEPGEPGVPALFGTLVLTPAVGVVVHEFGHLLACLAVGAEVKSFRLGTRRAAIRFRVRSVQVSLGWPYTGGVTYDGVSSGWKRVVILLAGPLMDLALGGIVLGASLAAHALATRELMRAAALVLGACGLVNLLPIGTRSGRLSDGARLLDVRSDMLAAKLLAARRTARRLVHAGRTAELIKLHDGLDVPAGRLSAVQAACLAVIESYVAAVPELPGSTAQLAERRVSMLLAQPDLGGGKSIACLALALLRLRRAGPENAAAAERFCERALAVKGLDDNLRRVVLAAIIASRKMRSLPHEDVRATAAATLKPADDTEALAASLKALFDPEGVLEDFRAGDQDARLGAGSVAAMLRRQGRHDELLELHAGLALQASRHPREDARSLHEVECNLLTLPGWPAEVIDEAASRVRWILDNYSFDEHKDQMPRAAVEHTLALARLRQGKFADVEPLCAAGLAADYGPDARATILATIAMARRELGQPYAELIAEAIALSPEADLMAEAAGRVR